MTTETMRTEIAADPFLTFAVRDLIAKGADEAQAMKVVLNTYGDESQHTYEA
jgi:cytochrome c-type biogenesis protein CcmH/NrfF